MKVLIVAAHPDDEVLGCGGAIAKHVANGDDVKVVFMADGETSRGRPSSGALVEERRIAALKASQILEIPPPIFIGFPDNKMDSIPLLDIVQKLEKIITNEQPNVIYTHHAGDLNIDHRITHQAVMTACRPVPCHKVDTLLFFEVVSSTEWTFSGSMPAFTPTWFVDISDTLPKKLDALSAYAGELRSWPHARSIEGIKHLVHWRGASVGLVAAEAFVLGRKLI